MPTSLVNCFISNTFILFSNVSKLTFTLLREMQPQNIINYQHKCISTNAFTKMFHVHSKTNLIVKDFVLTQTSYHLFNIMQNMIVNTCFIIQFKPKNITTQYIGEHILIFLRNTVSILFFPSTSIQLRDISCTNGTCVVHVTCGTTKPTWRDQFTSFYSMFAK